VHGRQVDRALLKADARSLAASPTLIRWCTALEGVQLILSRHILGLLCFRNTELVSVFGRTAKSLSEHLVVHSRHSARRHRYALMNMFALEIEF